MVEMENLYACNYIRRLHKEKKHLVSSSGEEFKNKLNVFENWLASVGVYMLPFTSHLRPRPHYSVFV